MPIYYIITQIKNVPGGYGVYELLDVFTTTLEDVIAGKYAQELGRYYSQGINAQTWLLYREPDNPFRDLGNNTTL